MPDPIPSEPQPAATPPAAPATPPAPVVTPPAAPAAAPAPEAAVPPAPVATPPAAATTTPSAGHDPAAYLGGYYAQFAQTGAVPDAALPEIAARTGQTIDAVRLTLDGLAHRRAGELRTLYDQVGGVERGRQVLEWVRGAPENVLPAERRAELNGLLQSPDAGTRHMAIRELARLYEENSGAQLETTTGRGTAHTAPNTATIDEAGTPLRRIVQNFGQDPTRDRAIKAQIHRRLQTEGAL